MNAIAVVDKQWGIGCQNKLLFSLPADLKRFQQLTTGKVVVMGKNTFMSLPGSKALKNRVNIVLTKQTGFNAANVLVCSDISRLQEILLPYPSDDIFVIGGQSVYNQLLEHCHKAYITKVNSIAPADCYFPNLDKSPQWSLCQASDIQENNGLQFTYCEYVKQG